jgi:hypothetical protein
MRRIYGKAATASCYNLAMTLSPRVLSTIACSSAPSAAGTLDLSSVCVEVVHEGVPFLRRYVEMAVGVSYGEARFCVPPLAPQTISVAATSWRKRSSANAIRPAV